MENYIGYVVSAWVGMILGFFICALFIASRDHAIDNVRGVTHDEHETEHFGA